MKVGDLVCVKKKESLSIALSGSRSYLVSGSIGIVIGLSLVDSSPNQLPIPDFPPWLVILSNGRQWTICETDLTFI